ncbi:Metalloendopeptidase [Operophtera brumata]|uniref:Metalloendopeptidase n=1 Tax=Operophtera brumata TaxID=104452 RepID=A0A0L7L3V4_OPEBR|nr:Metalloendopeptidase [Operophtera brumata]
MLRTLVALCLVGAVVGGPPVSKSREEIQNSYLEISSCYNNNHITLRFLVRPPDRGVILSSAHPEANPEASVWENSGKYQGDILLDDEQLESMVEQFSAGRNAYIWPNTLWPWNTVVYEFGAGQFDAAQRNYILYTMSIIEDRTCVRFRPRQNNEFNYVLLTYNFDRYDTDLVSNLGLPYEYDSCMHYDAYAFTINGRTTMDALRVLVVLCLIGLAAATPAIVRSREEIQAFRSFLESTKNNNDASQFNARSQSAPEANAEELSGKYEGDIVLDDFIIESMLLEFAQGRNAYTWPNTKWPNDTVSAAIEAGIKDIEDNTCVKFRYRQPEDTVYVRLTGEPSGCYAHVGYWATRGVHTLNLARNNIGVGCFRHATIVHEWMHILGFLHMQSTHDRDNYLILISPGTENNFAIYNQDLVDNLNVEYDYVSCLHYGPYSFTINGEMTIVALQEHEGVMGQREYITDKDWLRINRHYNCPGAWD